MTQEEEYETALAALRYEIGNKQLRINELKQMVIELEDANRHLAKVNDKLLADLKKAKNPAWLDQALNEGDGAYRP